MTAPVGPPVRVALAIHATGFLSLGLAPMLAVAIPLFGSAIEAAPFLIGVVLLALVGILVLVARRAGP